MVAHAFPLSRLAPNVRGLEPPAIGRLAEVRAPTLVVLGDKAAPHIHAIGKLIHDNVSGSKLATIPETGHTLVMENQWNLMRWLISFCEGNVFVSAIDEWGEPVKEAVL